MTRLKKRHAFVRELIASGQLETREIEGVERITAASFDRYVGRTPAAPDDVTALLDARIRAFFAERLSQPGQPLGILL